MIFVFQMAKLTVFEIENKRISTGNTMQWKLHFTPSLFFYLLLRSSYIEPVLFLFLAFIFGCACILIYRQNYVYNNIDVSLIENTLTNTHDS